MARLGLIITDEMESIIEAEAQKTRIIKSELVRMALEEFFARRGYEIKDALQWGGERDKKEQERD